MSIKHLTVVVLLSLSVASQATPTQKESKKESRQKETTEQTTTTTESSSLQYQLEQMLSLPCDPVPECL